MDGARRLLAFDLFDLAVKFICLHEQGHYLSGHLDVVRAHGADFYWAETAWQQRFQVEPSEMRVFEIQADSFASQVLMNPHAQAGRNARQVSEDPILTAYVLRCSTVAMAVVAALLEINDRQYAASNSRRTHPSAGARLLNMLRYVFVSRGEGTHENDSGFVATVVSPKIFTDVAHVLDILGAEPLSQDDFASFFVVGGEVAAMEGERAKEAGELITRVPPVRVALGDFAASALRRFSIPADEPPMSSEPPKWLDDRILKELGHLSSLQFHYYLMEAVVRSGEHLPWDHVGSPEFLVECIQRGAPVLHVEHPGVFVRKRSSVRC
jgi:hypothetical protein